MTINTKEVLKTLDGKPFKDAEGELTLGAVIANVLGTTETGGKMKLYSLAQKSFAGETLDVDDADLALIKKAIEDSRIYSNIIAGQALVLLEKVK